jgi:hypothetical protein
MIAKDKQASLRVPLDEAVGLGAQIFL